jgi:hypothetical protein
MKSHQQHYFSSFSLCFLLNCDRMSVTFILPVSITMASLSAKSKENGLKCVGVPTLTYICYGRKLLLIILWYLPNWTSILGAFFSLLISE